MVISATWLFALRLTVAILLASSTAALAKEAVQVPETPEGPVLPPTAASAILQQLGGSGARLGGRVIQRIDARAAEAHVHLGKSKDGPATSVVILRHRDQPVGSVARPGAFSVHPGEPMEDRVIPPIVERLKGTEEARFWQVIKPPEIEEAPPEPPADDPNVVGARDAIRLALHALELKEPEVARSRLQAIVDDPALRQAAGLDLAEAWHRVGDPKAARAAVVAWQKTTPRNHRSATALARSRVLSGVPAPLEPIGVAIKGDCDSDAVGRALDVVGRRADAHLLMQAMVREHSCLAPGLQRIAWLVEELKFEEADELSRSLVAMHPKSDEAVGRRAQVLMALKRPKEAVEVLEALAWADPDSGLLSALLGAYNRVPDDAWQVAKREEIVARATAEPDNEVAAFFAGVLLHYGGRFKESDERLEPLLKPLGKQPRLFIYLGMNAFNRDKTDLAMKYLAEAEALEAPDPDVYYCRAEVLRFSDPPAAIEDLDRYLAQTEGSPTSNPKKRLRVETMRSTLAACIERGDPIPCPGPWEHPYGHPANHIPGQTPDTVEGPGPLAYLGVVILGLVVTVVGLRRKKRRQGA